MGDISLPDAQYSPFIMTKRRLGNSFLSTKPGGIFPISNLSTSVFSIQLDTFPIGRTFSFSFSIFPFAYCYLTKYSQLAASMRDHGHVEKMSTGILAGRNMESDEQCVTSDLFEILVGDVESRSIAGGFLFVLSTYLMFEGKSGIGQTPQYANTGYDE